MGEIYEYSVFDLPDLSSEEEDEVRSDIEAQRFFDAYEELRLPQCPACGETIWREGDSVLSSDKEKVHRGECLRLWEGDNSKPQQEELCHWNQGCLNRKDPSSTGNLCTMHMRFAIQIWRGQW